MQDKGFHPTPTVQRDNVEMPQQPSVASDATCLSLLRRDDTVMTWQMRPLPDSLAAKPANTRSRKHDDVTTPQHPLLGHKRERRGILLRRDTFPLPQMQDGEGSDTHLPLASPHSLHASLAPNASVFLPCLSRGSFVSVVLYFCSSIEINIFKKIKKTARVSGVSYP
jgi:hypothetical protein